MRLFITTILAIDAVLFSRMPILERLVPEPVIRALKKQKYHLVGNHSAVKRCKWFYEALTSGRSCYKQKFYGINSHQCIQMSPALFYCTQECLFCWRAQNGDLNINWNEMMLPEWDPPVKIVDGILREQEKILGGYYGHPKTNPQRLREAYRPRHVAISLTGEPTLYDPLGELIRMFHVKGLTTFLVSNGNLPEKLSKLSQEPTQMYISVCAPNKDIFRRTCRPHIFDAWERLMESLTLLRSFSCPTVLRMTLVKNLNMVNVEEYAKLVEIANPTYVEVKAYMHVGFSSLRLGFDSMPSHGDVHDFAGKLSEKTGYKLLDEESASRVVLLSKLNQSIRFSPGNR
jgi:tRNA wybutosine-synthesizing protein 1